MSAPARGLFALALVVSLSNSLSAQTVQWRHDYSAARKEAVQTGRPLFLDFGTEACVWCKRLDASTFRAPTVVVALNTKFIPVKVDADRAMNLVQALGIQSYPTLIVAAPEGAILGRQDGYAEAAALMGILDRALAKLPRPQPAIAAATPVAARPLMPVSATVPASAPVAVRPASFTMNDPAREEIARKLSQVYLDRGLEFSRRGQKAEAEQYLELAASLSPDSSEAATARDTLGRLRAGITMP